METVKIDAIIFDFDGTILDTESACYQAWAEVYAEHGVELPPDQWAKAVGTAAGAFDAMSYLEARAGRPLDRARIEAARQARERELIASLPLRPGVRRLLLEAKARGLKLGLASNSGRAWVEGHLGPHGLLEHFDAMCTAGDVAQVKPAPDLYLLALERLGAAPEQTVAIEDSPSGATAALAAGVWCVVVPNEITRDYTFPPAHLRLPSLEGIGLDELARALITSGRRT